MNLETFTVVKLVVKIAFGTQQINYAKIQIVIVLLIILKAIKYAKMVEDIASMEDKVVSVENY